MKLKVGLSILVMSLLLPITSIYAVLNLELTKGIDSAIPIAIIPFQFQGHTKISTDITKVITNDLQNSGQFKALDLTTVRQLPHTLQTVDFNYWRKLDIDDLVIGNIQALGNNNYQINFTLLDIYKGDEHERLAKAQGELVNTAINPVLLNKEYIVKDRDLRRLAHQIADQIYQKLLGQRGIFATKIAYILVKRPKNQLTQYSLVVADVDGFNPQAIVTSDQPLMSPAWSPDGKQLAYVSFENRRASIYISDIATGNRKLITQFSGINGAPDWSSDGKKLALVLSKDGNPNIYSIDLDSGHLDQLTHDWSIDTEPAWSPDGKAVAFTSDRGGSPQIYQVALDSLKTQRLTFNGSYNAKASFSPDGKDLIFLHRNNGQYDIAIQDLKTGTIDVLSNFGDDQSPSIAPNGKMIIYASRNGDQRILALVSTDGSVKLRLPETEGDAREPAWSPFMDEDSDAN